jgi:hypothetical protein
MRTRTYYIGTEEECIAYDQKVTATKNYDGVSTKNWANPKPHPTDEYFAIVACGGVEPDEESSLRLVEALGEDWFATEELP